MPPSHRRARPPHARGVLPHDALAAGITPARLDAALAPFLPDADDRGFVVRCIVGEGPAHHRGASYALLVLAAALAEGAPPTGGETVAVPLRLPPHLAGEDKVFPLRMPVDALRRVTGADGPALDALVDALTDGPPHHALANAALVCLLDAALAARAPRG